MATTYEWDVEELEEVDNGSNDPDIVDHNHFDTYAEALAFANGPHMVGKPWRMVLVRDVGNDDEGLTDRAWAYVDYSLLRLPGFFEYGAGEVSGIAVPKRFQAEIDRRHRSN
jgi:hypothetical protein